MGSIAIWQLANKSVSVIGLEQFGIQPDSSGSRGESRLFRMTYMEDLESILLLMESKKITTERGIL